MDDRKQAFLRALCLAQDIGDKAFLEASKVNHLGTLMGLSLETVVDLVEALQEDGMVKAKWGGEVSVTSEGRELVTGKSGGDAKGGIQVINVNIGQGGKFQLAHGDGAVAGDQAMGAGAVRKGVDAGEIAAVLVELRSMQGQLAPEARQVSQELDNALTDTLAEVNHPKPDKVSLEQHLDRINTLGEKLAKISETGKKLWEIIKAVAVSMGANM